jgi:AcrR family transcriptional regulator
MPDQAEPRRHPRADALRNRERVLTAAREAFATEGPSVSLDEIARRAGLGPGTLHRHFPTKRALLAAVIADRLGSLADTAAELADATDAGAAFFVFFDKLVDAARDHLALAAVFTTPDEISDAAREAGIRLTSTMRVLLHRAQEVGAVRPDIDIGELHAIIAGALTIEQRLPSPASRGRGIRVIVDGLRHSGQPRPPAPVLVEHTPSVDVEGANDA